MCIKKINLKIWKNCVSLPRSTTSSIFSQAAILKKQMVSFHILSLIIQIYEVRRGQIG